MAFPAILPAVTASLTVLTDEAPAPEDVKAGWTAFAVFFLLIAAVVFLGFSLVKQLRKAEAARKAGVYGDPVEESGDVADEEPRDRPTADQPTDDRANGSASP